ncbi:MAG: 1-deoxy-D-xylulose-5-phosphate synthase [Proteobacteria bacterium]|nr:1-deoxy-D-xylulose-5-phosphate synthase [Pseudomonadota bacterium]NDC23313.1 1-deoxy-D-xylulose-5-phosphate synthase [Pseudomonadota bacterium]NDD03442.1 1-deoxy-D-xylulose-5-phosphate synthase [Pseudomonadota bacterium]NDG26143.1 1-deoxy-D-xylulose-5-phosphate synthase [Pseudomonadota bacterium]
MGKRLDKINLPEDLRQLKVGELQPLCKEVRDLILEVISKKGGHFSSNLGTVELSVALHYAFETPKDKLVWDVGHQAYPHKILTGRKNRFHTIRQYEGLSGFTSRAESEYDHFGAGHASTSISAALGIAEGMKLGGLPHFAVAIIGDGSMTGGLAFEALNNAGHIPAKNLVVILNDNDMAIDPNVGALNRFVNHALVHPGYNRLRKELKGLMDAMEHCGMPITGVASRLRKSMKNFFTPGILFECLGFRYMGPIDGHDVNALVEAFSFVKSESPKEGPYLVHVLTKKGKGYKLAEENSLKYHGVTPFEIEEGIKPSGPKKANYQDVFADTLVRLAKEDPRIVAITAAMPSGTGISKFQKEFPKRTYDVGIAEGHAVLFAAGLATEGFRPVAAIYSTFLQRAFDQCIHDVGIQNLPVVFAMDRAGLVGADGVTHQGAFDLSYLRAIPNFVIMAPKDENELQHMVKTAVQYQGGPIAFRYPRGEVVGVPMDKELTTLPLGKGEVLKADASAVDVLLIGIGYAVQTVLEAQALLQAQGYKTASINARFVKPLDEKLILEWCERSKLVVTVEENTVCGGFGSSILELMHSRGLNLPALILGLPDAFIDHASPQVQRKLTGLVPQTVTSKTILKLEELGLTRSPTTRLKSTENSLVLN